MALFRKRKPTPAAALLPALTVPQLPTPTCSGGGTAVSRLGASRTSYPTLSHGNAGMDKNVQANLLRAETNTAIRRYGAIALAELWVEATGNTQALCGSL